MSIRMQSIVPGLRANRRATPSLPSLARKISSQPSLSSCLRRTVRLIWLSSQQRMVKPRSGFSSEPFLLRKTFGAAPRAAFGDVMPSMTATSLSSARVPASTDRAVMKHRKIEPLPTVDDTSIRPACSSHRSVRAEFLVSFGGRPVQWGATNRRDSLLAIHRPRPDPPQVVCVNGEAL